MSGPRAAGRMQDTACPFYFYTVQPANIEALAGLLDDGRHAGPSSFPDVRALIRRMATVNPVHGSLPIAAIPDLA